MKRHGLSAAGLATIVVLALPSVAAAGTHTLNFDSTAAGTPVGSGPGGLSLNGSPIAFTAGSNAASPPNGLRRAGDCPVPPSGGMFGQCPSGDNRLEMTFSNPARFVSLRAGIPATGPCFETDCPQARMVGFNAANNVVAVSQITDIFEQNMSNNDPIEITDESQSITRAVFAVGENPEPGGSGYFGYKHTAQIDNLTYNVLEAGDPPPPPAPAPPAIEITDPPEGQSFASTNVNVSGTSSAAAGVADMCAAANAPPDFPVACRRRFSPRPDGGFSVGLIPGMRPGANEIRVWLRDTRGRVATDTVNVRVADGDVDYAVETMEVTQAIQTKQLPAADETLAVPGLGPGDLPADTYDGVPLAEGKQTAVRLFGEARGAAGPVRGVPAILRGYRSVGGRLRELPSSPIAPTGIPTAVDAEADMPVLRASATGGWTFLLPSSWTSGNIVLVGEVAPGTISEPARDCCPSNNFLALQQVPFSPVRSTVVYPVALEVTDPGTPTVSPAAPLSQWYSELLKVWPGGWSSAAPRAADAATGQSHDDLNALLNETYRDAGLGGKISGLFPPTVGGGLGTGPASTTGAITRKLDMVTHEVGHSLNLAHAMSGDACTDPNGGDIGTVELRGTINGVGLDPGIWSSGTTGHFKPIAAEEAGVFDATPDAPNFVYDYMSYCSVDSLGKTWVSVGYWANTVRGLREGGEVITDDSPGCCGIGAAADPTVVPRITRGDQSAQPTLSVSAALRPGANEILDVQTGREQPTPSAPGSDVEVVVRDASGGEVSRTPVLASPLEERTGPQLPPGRFVSAVVPGAGAASVDIVVGGNVVATRSASPSVPQVELRSPGNGDRIGSGGNLAINWSASDGDGGELVSTVEFSADSGRTWKPLGIVRSGGQSLRIARSELPRTNNGELRVTTGDGFNAGSDGVTRLRTAGAKPEVTIVSPPNGTRVRADAPVLLEGSAFDDAGNPIPGRRLEWSSGKKRLGRGESADALAYELGRQVTLQARDSAGRAGSDRIRLRIEKVSPIFTALDARRLGARSKEIDLRVASSLPGTLSVSGKGVRGEREGVGPKEETIEIGIRGSVRDAYALKLKLSAAGKRTSQTLQVDRAG